MIFLILLVWLFLPAQIFALPQVSVISLPSSVSPQSNFPVSFLVTNTNIGSTYYYKFFGGIGESINSIRTNSELSYNSPWINFPRFTSDLGGSAIIDSSAFIIPEAIPGLYNFKIRVVLVSNTSSGATSPPFSLLVSIPEPVPTIEITPTNLPTVFPTSDVTPTSIPSISSPLILSEFMANPETGQDEWIEIYNPSSDVIPLKNICFFDASQHSRCFSDNEFVTPNSYYSHSFSSGFLNNDGDTITFLNSSITYPKSAKNFSYSRQNNDSWCFSISSQNSVNNDCSSLNEVAESSFSPPQLTLQFSPDSITAGDDFNLVFSLNTSDLYLLRLISPFGSQYFPFGNFHDGYSWLTLPLSIPKKLPEALYPMSFHLKKAGSSHLFDYQLGNLNVKAAVVTPKVSKSKVLGTSTYSCPVCPNNSQTLNCAPPSTLRKVLPDANFFSWPFLFVGSILFLSPILFPKLYSA